MNFLSMEYFMAVVAKRNITKAAEELHITQQTLSAHISAIEKELACQLIVRSNPLELTYAGEVFLKYASVFYENYQSMWNEFNDLTNNERGKLLIGVEYTRSFSIMPKIVAAFQTLYPNIEVRIQEGTNKSLHRSLVNKDIDLAIACFPKTLKGIEIRDFYEEEVVMLVPAGLPVKIEDRSCLSGISDFSGFPFVLGGLDEMSGQIGSSMIAKAGFQPAVKAQSDNIGMRILLCVRGVGICFCPENFVRSVLSETQINRVLIYHLKGNSKYQIRFGFRKDTYLWRMVSEFIRVALEEKKLEI